MSENWVWVFIASFLVLYGGGWYFGKALALRHNRREKPR